MPGIIRVRTAAALPLLLVAILLASMLALPSPADALTGSKRVGKAFHVVKAQQGDRYSYGAAGPHRFDCSGLIYFSYRKAGYKKIPRTSRAQAQHTKRIKRSNMRKGDLVFFHSRGSVYHVGVFAGSRNGRRTIIHSPSTGKRVNRDPIWTNSWFPGTVRRR